MAIRMRSRHGGYLVTVVPVAECDLHSEEEHEVSLINSMMGDLEDLLFLVCGPRLCPDQLHRNPAGGESRDVHRSRSVRSPYGDL